MSFLFPDVISQAPGVDGRSLAAADAGRSPAAAAALLVQRGDERTKCVAGVTDNESRVRIVDGLSIVDALDDDALILAPERSAGAFDPMGARKVDRERAQDLVAMSHVFKDHRVMFVTLTTRRDGPFLDPQMAFLAANDRVREVCAEVTKHSRGVWAATIEPQTKTGPGFIHWHCLCWVSPADTRSVEQIGARVAKKWRDTQHVYGDEEVNCDTGEVVRPEISRFYEPIGRVDVQAAGSIEGTMVYVAKYITKPWEAVPPWMGNLPRKFYKLRESMEYKRLQYRLCRRVQRHFKPRPVVVARRRRPARPLYERMARSGGRTAVFRRAGASMRFVGVIARPFHDLESPVLLSPQAKVLVRRFGDRLGKPVVCVPGACLDELRRLADGARCREYVANRVDWLLTLWDECQSRRRAEDAA